MRSNRNHVSLIIFVAVNLLILSPQTVLADKTVDAGKSGSVTIRYFDDVDARTPVVGAEFTFYKIDDSREALTYTDTTNQDGILKISDMKLGRYRVVETSPSPGHKASASFLLTIPMTDHNEWVYDLSLEPKASLDLPTTSKSVYSVSGNQDIASLFSGGVSRGSTAGTGFSTSRPNGSGSSLTRGLESDTVSKVMPAGTGDDSHGAFWAVVNAIAGIIAISLLCKAVHSR